MATIYDIARLANVSAMTVSRVINKTGRVSEKTRVKVQQVMDDMHYIPNSIARCLVTQESKVISLLITDICNPFFTTMARGAEDAALQHGYRLMFGNSDEQLLKERHYVEMILSMKVDGVLFSASNDMSIEHLQWLEQHNVPFVLLDREVPGIQADTVRGDSRTGTKQMISRLIQMGHTRIGLVNGLHHISTARERRLGYIEAHVEAGIPIQQRYMTETSYIPGDQPNLIKDWFSDHEDERPTAIFAANNLQALSIMKEAREIGLRIPEDLSVACFDELGYLEDANPFLSVVSQPAYEFGQLGFKLLLERMLNSKLPPRIETLPCEIKIRDSVISRTSVSPIAVLS
ncbi:LacI family DNA-binding transcriptional regulator [Paenibacillus marinisediminis]